MLLVAVSLVLLLPLNVSGMTGVLEVLGSVVFLDGAQPASTAVPAAARAPVRNWARLRWRVTRVSSPAVRHGATGMGRIAETRLVEGKFGVSGRQA